MVCPWRFAGAFAGLARPTASAFAPSALVGEFASEPSQGIEDAVVDVLDDVKDAELMTGVGPEFGQHGGVEVRAVGDDHVGQEAVVLEVVQEAPHVVLIVGRNQGEGDGEIAQRVGGQKQRAVAQVQFVDAQGAGEMVEGPLAVGGHVGLADLPVEAVVEEAVGQVEEEVALQRLLQAIHAHAVVEQAVDDGFADAVGVLGSRFDALDLGAEGLAAGAAGAVFSDRQFDDEDLAESDVADRSCVGVLARRPRLPQCGQGKDLWGTIATENANGGMASMPVSFWVGVVTPGRHRLDFLGRSIGLY